MGGIERFIAELSELGLVAEQRGNLVVVTLDVSLPGCSGPLFVGADPPNDFPRVPPHWVHLSSEVQLPNGGPRGSELGPDWRKWSRMHPKWKGGYGAREWVAHVRSLLLTATPA